MCQLRKPCTEPVLRVVVCLQCKCLIVLVNDATMWNASFELAL